MRRNLEIKSSSSTYSMSVYILPSLPLIPTRSRFDDFMEKEIEIKGD